MIYIQYTIYAIILLICIFNFNSILKWIKPSLEDGKGEASYKRLIALTLIIEDGYLIVNNKIIGDTMLMVHYSLLAAMLITAAIVSTENILTLVKIAKGVKTDDEAIKTGDKVTIQKEETSV